MASPSYGWDLCQVNEAAELAFNQGTSRHRASCNAFLFTVRIRTAPTRALWVLSRLRTVVYVGVTWVNCGHKGKSNESEDLVNNGDVVAVARHRRMHRESNARTTRTPGTSRRCCPDRRLAA
jgi:hypothetical protein